MGYEKTSHFLETLIQISNLKFHFTPELLESAQEIIPEFSSFDFTSIPKEIKQLKDLLREQTEGAKSILQKLEISFPFDDRILNHFKEIEEKNYKLNTFYATIVLMAFLSWMKTCFIDSSYNFYENLAQTLFDTRCPELQSTINSAFLDVYIISINYIPISNFPTIFPIIYKAFTSYPELIKGNLSLLARNLNLILSEPVPQPSSNAIQFFAFLSLFFDSTKPDQLSATMEDYNQIATLLEPFVLELNINAIGTYYSIIPYIDQSLLEGVITVLPNSLIKLIKKEEPYIQMPEPQEPFLVTLNLNKDTSFVFGKEYGFQDGFSIDEPTVIIPPISKDSICPPSIIHLINSVFNLFVNDQLTNRFIDSFTEAIFHYTNSPRYVDIFAVALYIYNSFTKEQNESTIDAILTSPILDPHYLIQDNKNNIFNNARQIAVEVLLKDSPDSFTKLFTTVGTSPLLLAEISERACLCIDSLCDILADPRAIRIISSLQLFYKPQSIEEAKIYDIARKGIFRIIYSVVKLSWSFFTDPLFISSFMSCIFENKMESFIFQIIEKYIISLQSSQDSQLFYQTLEQLMKQLLSNLNDPRYVSLITKLFEMILHVLEQNPFLCDNEHSEFRFIESLIFDNKSHFPHQLNYIFSYLRQFVRTSSQIGLGIIDKFELVIQSSSSAIIQSDSKTEKSNKTEIINELEEDYMKPNDIYSKLISLVSNFSDENEKNKKDLSIYQPQVLILLYNLFWNAVDSKSEDYCNILQNFADFSVQNCIEIHKTGIDLLLLKQLKKETQPLDDKILHIFETVGSFISSPVFVQKFISLLKLPYRRQKLIDFLTSIFLHNYNCPIRTLPLMPHVCPCSYQSISFDPSKGFTFTAWVYDEGIKIMTPHVYLFMFKENNDFPFQCVIEQGFLGVNINDHFYPISKSPFPPKKWSFVAVSYEPQYTAGLSLGFGINIGLTARENGGIIRCWIDDKPLKICEQSDNLKDMNLDEVAETETLTLKIPAIEFKSNNRNLVFGRSNFLSGYICNFGVYPLCSKEQISELYRIGCRNTEIDSLPSFVQKSGFFTPTNIHEFCTSRAYLQSYLNFANTLLLICKLDLILPLFAQTDNDFISLLNLLSTALQTDENTQQDFALINGFEIISHLLLSSDFHGLTYELYKKFYEILGFIKPNQTTLKNQLISSILLSFELWTKESMSEFYLIATDWKQNLFPALSSEINDFLPFSKFISLLRIYTWYSKEDNHLNTFNSFSRGNEDRKNISDIRKTLLKCVHEVYLPYLIVQDFMIMVQSCCTITDYPQVYDLLLEIKVLINKLSENRKFNVIKELAIIPEVITAFHILLISKEDYIICLTLEILGLIDENLIHYLSITKGDNLPLINSILKENDHFELFFHQLKTKNIHKDFLLKLAAETFNNVPQIFPVLCYYGYLNGQETLASIFDTLTPSPELLQKWPPTWSIFSISVAILSSQEIKSKIFLFLLHLGSKVWYTIFAMITHVCEILKHRKFSNENTFDIEENENLFVSLLISNFDKIASIEDIKVALHIIFFFICFRPNHSNNNALISLYKNSIFNIDDKHTEEEEASTPKEDTIVDNWISLLEQCLWIQGDKLPNDELETILFSSPIHNTHYHFGLRIDEDTLKWLDQDKATFFLKTISENRLVEYLDQGFLISKLIRNDNGFLMDMQLTEQELYPHSSFILYSKEQFSSVLYDNSIPSLVSSEILQAISQSLQNILTYEKESITNSAKLIGNCLFHGEEANIALEKTQNSIRDNLELSKKNWNVVWAHLSMENAPWSMYTITKHKIHYKRNFNICRFFCPVKLKKNKSFDDHSDAAEMRKKGEFVKKIVQPKSSHPFEILDEIPKEDEENLKKLGSSIINQNCEIIKAYKSIPATFILTKTEFALDYRNSPLSQTNTANSLIVTTIDPKNPLKHHNVGKTHDSFYAKRIVVNLDQIKAIFWRRRTQHPTAIEIFLIDGRSFFIDFLTIKNSIITAKFAYLNTPEVMPNIEYLQTVPPAEFIQTTDIVEKWVSHSISTFEYLMTLNIFAGRTFNDPAQYPFLPWIVADYNCNDFNAFLQNDRRINASKSTNDTTSHFKNATNSNTSDLFRDLHKPIGAIGEERLLDLKNRLESFISFKMDPYLYSSYSSSPLVVFNFLIRQEPFTSLHIAIQGGRFDHANRQFASINEAYSSACTQLNDYRELCPEFFCAPEFLENRDDFDLGIVDGHPLSGVSLPPWASSPLDFIYKHRQLLESPNVSSHISSWVDLTFGYLQRGESAVAADNTYKPEMYDDVWTKEPSMSNSRVKEIEATVNFVGQVPPQLFFQPQISRPIAVIIPSLVSKPIAFELPLLQKPISEVKLSFVFARQLSSTELAITAISDSGTLSRASVRFRETVSARPDFSLKIPYEISCATAIDNRAIAIVHSAGLDVSVVTSLGTETMKRSGRRVLCTASDGDWLATGADDARVYVYRVKPGKIKAEYSVPIFRDSIPCVACSASFGLLVACSADGQLMLCDLYSGQTSRVTALGLTPHAVIVTPAWGFVVVYGSKREEAARTQWIQLYTVNGDFVRECRVQYEMKQWTVWESRDAFDFLAMADEMGKIFMCEVYELDFEKRRPYRCHAELAGLNFLKEGDCLSAVTSQGKQVLIPRDYFDQ